MQRYLRRRSDGLLQIRPARWGFVLLARDLSLLAAALVVWAASMAVVVRTIVVSPLLVVAVTVVGPLFWAAMVSRTVPSRTPTPTEPGAPPRRAA